MSFFENVFRREETSVETYDDFWKWFARNEKRFYKVLKENGDVEKDFFDELSPKLDELRDGFFFLAGMWDDNTAELIVTADGTIKNIVFVEELIEAAPIIKGWRFTALKPESELKDSNMTMAGYSFKEEKISFYSNEDSSYPDEIDITIVHEDLDEENASTVANGTFIFLDNFIGELGSATQIDSMNVVGRSEAVKELVPISKLKDFLIWRQKEFIEKYEGIRHNTEDDNHSMLEFTMENGNTVFAIVNTDLLEWDSKASHPWILSIVIKYEAENNGMPNDETYAMLDEVEDKIMEELIDSAGYLNIGRETGEGSREIYFACKDFRRPSKVLSDVERNYSGKLELSYDICKDKYWRTLNHLASV